MLILTGILFLTCLWLSACNWTVVLRYWLTKKHSSLAPFIGGVCGAIAVYIMPVDHVKKWVWLPLFVDVGCVPLLVFTLCFFYKQRHS